MTAKINEDFRFIFRLQIQKEKYGYVLLRIKGRKGLDKEMEIPIYLQSGQRLMAKRNQFKGGQFDKGLPAQEIATLNKYLSHLKAKANNYTTFNKAFTKEQVENVIYTSDKEYQFVDNFLENVKKKQIRTLQVTTFEHVETDLKKELNRQYPKKRVTEEIITVDDDGFEITEKKEIIIDPLSLKDFPKNFPKPLYERYKKEMLSSVDEEERNKLIANSKDEVKKWFFDQRLSFYIQSKYVFHNSIPKETINIDKEIIQAVEKEVNSKRPDGLMKYGQAKGKTWNEAYGAFKIENDFSINGDIKQKLVAGQLAKERPLMKTVEIYEQNLWNRNNIFEMFGTIYYDKAIPETYHKILVRLMEYRELKHPKEDIKYLNAQWLIDFFTFLKENGWYTINTMTFDPLKYDKKIFHQDKERQPYKPKSLNKMIGITKTLINSTNNKFSFVKKGYILKLDLTDLRLNAITDERDEEGTRIDHSMIKDELDQLFWYEFDQKKVDKYQQIFDEVNKTKLVNITINDLDNARKLFILQTMFGGLRGYKELHTAKLLKHKAGVYKVAFYQNKVTQTVHNPLNDYTEKILKPLDYKIPVLERVNARDTDKKSASIGLLESHYRALLQTIGKIIDFDREVITDTKKFLSQPISELFNPYFSRKTFGTIMATELGLHDKQIELFTGHKGELTQLSSSYVNRNTIEEKAKLIAKLKVGKNPFKKSLS